MKSSMGARIDAYVDTSALIAFLDASDTHHPLFRRLFSDPPRLATTTLVVAEGHGWFLRRYDRTRALQFLAMIDSLRPLLVLSVGVRKQQAAWKLMLDFSDQDLTVADAVGLHEMRARDIESCWSTDHHLGLTGVPLVIHQY